MVWLCVRVSQFTPSVVLMHAPGNRLCFFLRASALLS